MMSLTAIVALNEEIAVKAAQEGRLPFVPVGPDDVDRWATFPFPNLGPYEPAGWEQTETSWFVDKTGVGYPSEPALTVAQFKNELRRYIAENPGHGFAITEEGPFQLYVSAFRRIAAKAA
jgi:hypothetical protein